MSQNDPNKDKNFKWNKKIFPDNVNQIPINYWDTLLDENKALWIKILCTFTEQDSDEEIEKVKNEFVKKCNILPNEYRKTNQIKQSCLNKKRTKITQNLKRRLKMATKPLKICRRCVF